MPTGDSNSGNHPLGKGTMILDPEECPKCGYNLQGLHRGGVCPECGRGITSGARGSRVRLLDAPRGYLARLVATFLMLGWAGLGAFVGAALPAMVITLPVVRTRPFVGGVASVATLVALAGTGAWALGVLVLCKPRPGFTQKNPEPRQWARLAISTQPLWPCALLLVGVSLVTGIEAFGYAAYVLAWIAGIGMVPTAMQIAEYADWADDLNLGIQVRTAGWMIGVGALVDGAYRLAVVADFAVVIIIMIVWVFTTLIMMGGLLLLSLRCLQLSTVARWAIINSKDAEARDARLVEKAEEDRRERDRRIAAQQKAAEATTNPPETHGPRVATGEKVIETTDDQPYGLEEP